MTHDLIRPRMTKSQMMREVAGGRSRETFTHTHFGTFDITATRELVKQMRLRGERPHVCVFADMRRRGSDEAGKPIVDWLRGEREVDMARVAELSPSQVNEPVIHAVHEDGSHYPIDGLHRMVRRAQDGRVDFRYWAIPMHLVPRPKPGVWVDVPWGLMDVVGDKLMKRGEK